MPTMAGRMPGWLWGYPRTSGSKRPIASRCPRSVHGGALWATGRVATGRRAVRRNPAGSPSRGAARRAAIDSPTLPGRDMKMPGGTAVLHRVPQSKLQRSQGFGPSAPSGKENYALGTRRLPTGLSTTFAVPGSDSGRLSTALPPTRRVAIVRGPGPPERPTHRSGGGRARRGRELMAPEPGSIEPSINAPAGPRRRDFAR